MMGGFEGGGLWKRGKQLMGLMMVERMKRCESLGGMMKAFFLL